VQIAARAGHSVAVLLTACCHCIHGQDDFNQQIGHVLEPSAGLTDRSATVNTALGYATPDGVRVFQGTVSGSLAAEPQARSRGHAKRPRTRLTPCARDHGTRVRDLPDGAQSG
jgi:hypothetical protein